MKSKKKPSKRKPKAKSKPKQKVTDQESAKKLPKPFDEDWRDFFDKIKRSDGNVDGKPFNFGNELDKTTTSELNQPESNARKFFRYVKRLFGG